MPYSLSEEYVWKEVGERVVILNLDSGRYYSLNSSGSLIWRGLLEGLSTEQIADQLCAAFRVDEHTAKEDTEKMIRELSKKKAIVFT